MTGSFTRPETASAPIRRAGGAEAPAVSTMLAEAFHDDPLTVWNVPAAEDRRSVLSRYFGKGVRQAIESGSVYVIGGIDAVAVWMDATVPQPPLPLEPTTETIELCGRYAENFHTLDRLMHDAEPAAPHHHLAFLAVRSGLRRSGLGSELLAAHHRHLDTCGLGASLDASTKNSRRLYLRHGYQDLAGPFLLPGGTPVWPMWRPPGRA
jgi:ribosomal protein S18 acetylase RimI-like enzyme